MRKLIFGSLVALLIGCAAAIDGNRVALSDNDSDLSQPVAKLFREKCQSCHKPIDPNKFNDDKLRLVIAGHRKRARLSSEEVTQLADYLIEQKRSQATN